MALRGRHEAAGRLLGRVAMAGAAYMATVIVVSLIYPRRVTAVGETQCFDDWCIDVEGFTKEPGAGGLKYTVEFRVSSRARRVSQRENNLSVYVTDSEGRRFEGQCIGDGPDFNALLGPGESVLVKRVFITPGTARGVGAVITHEGGFPVSWFIIGYDTWFRKPALTLLGQDG